MKWLILASAIFLTFVFFKSVLAANSEITIRGAKVTISGGYLDLGARQIETPVISTTTGQCIGIMCGVTYAN